MLIKFPLRILLMQSAVRVTMKVLHVTHGARMERAERRLASAPSSPRFVHRLLRLQSIAQARTSPESLKDDRSVARSLRSSAGSRYRRAYKLQPSPIVQILPSPPSKCGCKNGGLRPTIDGGAAGSQLRAHDGDRHVFSYCFGG